MNHLAWLRRRTFIAAAAGGTVAAMLASGVALAQEKVTWRVQSHWPKASSSFDDSLGVIADLVKERTDGNFVLETYGAGEFGKGTEVYNLVRRGVVEMGTTAPGYLQNEATTYAFLHGIPGTLRESWEMMHYIKNMGVEDLINEELNDDGVLFLAEKVYPTELVVSSEVSSIEDFRSLKLRSSGTFMDYLSAVGAAPQMIGGSELYQALSSGVVDGAHWGAAVGAQSMSLWEVAPYHLQPSLGVNVDAFIINMEALEELPEEYRKVLLDTINERFFLRSTEYNLKEAIALTEGKEQQNVKVLQLPQDVLDAFAEASETIVDEEAARGPLAEQAAQKLRELMGQLGYL